MTEITDQSRRGLTKMFRETNLRCPFCGRPLWFFLEGNIYGCSWGECTARVTVAQWIKPGEKFRCGPEKRERGVRLLIPRKK